MGEPIHRKIPRNKAGRDFVVGDVHGCYDLLKSAMMREGFDKARDRLFSVGDIIDRGPKSRKCLSLLDKPWFYMVRGNHEQMMIDSVLGGDDLNWQNEYGRWSRKMDAGDVHAWAERLAALPISMTIKGTGFKVGICHAEPDGTDWKRSRINPKSEQVMVWGRRVLRRRPKSIVDGIDITIHGHTPLENPVWVGNRYFMDTGAWYSGELTLRKIHDIHKEYADRAALFGA